jgi:hypothetical protein
MKGPNPFAFLEDNPENVAGRKYETGVFNAAVQASSARQPRVLVVSGGQGTGKTFLLRYFRHEAEKAGILAPYARVEKGESEAAVAGRLYNETALLLGFRPSGAHPGTFSGLVEALERGGRGRYFGMMLFIDDIDRLKKAGRAVESIVRLAESLQGKRAVGFALGSTAAMKLPESQAVIPLAPGPFSEHDVNEVVEKGLGKGPPKMGEECLRSIMADTGGNPRLVKAVCRHIYDRLKDNEKVITKGHYLAYLPYIMSMLSAEWFGRAYQETPEAERRILAVLAQGGEMHVSDIAKALGRPLGQTTALVKRLLDSGQIIRIGRGRYRIFAALYGRYVLQMAGGQPAGAGNSHPKPGTGNRKPFRLPSPSPSRKQM